MKYGWEIADEVQRFVGNSADIQYVLKAEYDNLKAKYQKALSALKYYGSTSLGETGAWGFRKKFCFDLVQTEDLDFLPEPICENGKKYVIGGKLARQTLTELGEKE